MKWVFSPTFSPTEKMSRITSVSKCPYPLVSLTFCQLLSIIRRYKRIFNDKLVNSNPNPSNSYWRKGSEGIALPLKCFSSESNFVIQILKIMNEIKLLSVKQLCHLFDCSKSKIYRLMREDKFPQPIQFGRSVRWKYIDIRDYQNNLEVA